MNHNPTFFMEEICPAFYILTDFEIGLIYMEVWGQ